MKSKFIYFLIWCLVCASTNAQTIENPVSYYLEQYKGDPGGKLLAVKLDFSKDGKKCIFVALASSGDKSGYLWLAFKPVKNGYERIPVLEVNGVNAEGAIRFRDDVLYNGYIPKLKAYGLLTYAPDNETGDLIAITIQDGVLKERTIKRISPQGEDSKLYNSLFHVHAHNPQIEELQLASK